MSGGSYNRLYYQLEDTYAKRMYDVELNELIEDLVPIFKAVEWWQSGDTEEDSYRKKVATFKKKWFKTTRKDMIKRIVETECQKLKEDLLNTL